MPLPGQHRKWLQKKAKRGIRGYPVGTIAFYGPDAGRASKVAVGIVLEPDGETADLRRWTADDHDLRADLLVADEIVGFLREHGALSVAMADRIIGCPHEEAIDYPDGEACPQCPYWKGRNRWTGELEPD